MCKKSWWTILLTTDALTVRLIFSERGAWEDDDHVCISYGTRDYEGNESASFISIVPFALSRFQANCAKSGSVKPSYRIPAQLPMPSLPGSKTEPFGSNKGRQTRYLPSPGLDQPLHNHRPRRRAILLASPNGSSQSEGERRDEKGELAGSGIGKSGKMGVGRKCPPTPKGCPAPGGGDSEEGYWRMDRLVSSYEGNGMSGDSTYDLDSV